MEGAIPSPPTSVNLTRGRLSALSRNGRRMMLTRIEECLNREADEEYKKDITERVHLALQERPHIVAATRGLRRTFQSAQAEEKSPTCENQATFDSIDDALFGLRPRASSNTRPAPPSTGFKGRQLMRMNSPALCEAKSPENEPTELYTDEFDSAMNNLVACTATESNAKGHIESPRDVHRELTKSPSGSGSRSRKALAFTVDSTIDALSIHEAKANHPPSPSGSESWFHEENSFFVDDGHEQPIEFIETAVEEKVSSKGGQDVVPSRKSIEDAKTEATEIETQRGDEDKGQFSMEDCSFPAEVGAESEDDSVSIGKETKESRQNVLNLLECDSESADWANEESHTELSVASPSDQAERHILSPLNGSSAHSECDASPRFFDPKVPTSSGIITPSHNSRDNGESGSLEIHSCNTSLENVGELSIESEISPLTPTSAPREEEQGVIAQTSPPQEEEEEEEEKGVISQTSPPKEGQKVVIPSLRLAKSVKKLEDELREQSLAAQLLIKRDSGFEFSQLLTPKDPPVIVDSAVASTQSVESITSNITSLIDQFVSEGVDWFSVVDEAFQFVSEPTSAELVGCVGRQVFESRLSEYFGLDVETCQVICTEYQCQQENSNHVRLLDMILDCTGQKDITYFKLRLWLCKEAREWGLESNLSELYSEFIGGEVSDCLESVHLEAYAAKVGLADIVDCEELLLSIAPFSNNNVSPGYCDFAGYIHDPWFSIEVLPKLLDKFDTFASVPVPQLERKFQLALTGVNSSASFRNALVSLGFSTGRDALRMDILNRVVNRFDATGKGIRFRLDLFFNLFFPESSFKKSVRFQEEQDIQEFEDYIQDDDENEVPEQDEELWAQTANSKRFESDDWARTYTPSKRNNPNKMSRRLAPAAEDLVDIAVYLGIDVHNPEDREFLWIAEECLYAPLPAGWHQARSMGPTGQGDLYYWRADDHEKRTQWEHPLDPFYRKLYERLKNEKLQRRTDVEWNSNVNRRRRRSNRPLSAVPLQREGERVKSGVNTVEWSILLDGKQLEQEEVKNVSTSSRPKSALVRSGKNRVMPLGQVAGYGNCDEDVNQSAAWTKGRKGRSTKVEPMCVDAAMTEQEFTGVEADSEFSPQFRPFPEDVARPILLHDGKRQLAPEDLFGLARFFQVELPQEAHLMWIIKLAALASLPDHWRLCYTEGEPFYANEETFQICRYHPLDPFFSLLLQAERDIELSPEEEEQALEHEVWLSFLDEDGDIYRFDFSRNVTKYETKHNESTRVNYSAPMLVRRSAQMADFYEPYRTELWKLLYTSDGVEGLGPAKIFDYPGATLMGKMELVKLTILLEWLMATKDVEYETQKKHHKLLKNAVKNRRITSQQLISHIVLKNK